MILGMLVYYSIINNQVCNPLLKANLLLLNFKIFYSTKSWESFKSVCWLNTWWLGGGGKRSLLNRGKLWRLRLEGFGLLGWECLGWLGCGWFLWDEWRVGSVSCGDLVVGVPGSYCPFSSQGRCLGPKVHISNTPAKIWAWSTSCWRISKQQVEFKF